MKAPHILLLIIIAIGLLYSGILPYKIVKSAPDTEKNTFQQSAAPTCVEESTAEAIRLYPALAHKDSPLNKAFVALYNDAQRTNPELLSKPDWPLILAKRTADSVNPPPRIETPSPEPKPSTPPVRLEGKVVRHVGQDGIIIRCSDNPPIVSSMGAIGGGGGAVGGSMSDVFGTFLLRGHPKEAMLADGDEVTCIAYENGMFQINTRTLRAYLYTDSPQKTEQQSTPSRWKPAGTALDQKPKR